MKKFSVVLLPCSMSRYTTWLSDMVFSLIDVQWSHAKDLLEMQPMMVQWGRSNNKRFIIMQFNLFISVILCNHHLFVSKRYFGHLEPFKKYAPLFISNQFCRSLWFRSVSIFLVKTNSNYNFIVEKSINELYKNSIYSKNI